MDKFEKALITLTKKSEPKFSKGLGTLGSKLKAIARDMDRDESEISPIQAAEERMTEQTAFARISLKDYIEAHGTGIVAAETNSAARRINDEIQKERRNIGYDIEDPAKWQNAVEMMRSRKRSQIYVCEGTLHALDLFEKAKENGEDAYFRPPLVIFGKEAVDRYDAMKAEEAQSTGTRYYGYVREGRGKSAVMEGYIRAQREHAGHVYAIAPRNRAVYSILNDMTEEEIERQKATVQAAIDAGMSVIEPGPVICHSTSPIDEEPKVHLHNVIMNVSPRTKGKSVVAGQLANLLRDSARLPLAGTHFDPRRYRRIK
ncbi:hypothetical protein G6L68_25435 [Agrobacterium fabrum]|uniref:hypothetical protein n=1 Tax=Agrobacterium fabrum TaxID=1176649 RepID=UPI000EF5B1A9|nr:hypothetical protein [Agrobacterium fabrum]AYM66129.1 hypothetical protein At12D13_49770 [Agrobacterium fabrum]NTE63978.1 hypothetical protein [Agrobacterium fabrum]